MEAPDLDIAEEAAAEAFATAIERWPADRLKEALMVYDHQRRSAPADLHLLVRESAMEQRIIRAKAKIKAARHASSAVVAG